MELLNNNEPLPAVTIPEEGFPLPDLIINLSNEISSKGNIITSFKINGELCDLNKINQDQLVKNSDKIELFSDNPVNITKQSLNDIEKQVDDFIPEIDDIVSDLIKGDKVSSFKRFNSFLEKFKDITRLLKTIETLFQIDFSKINAGGKSVQEFIDDLLKILVQVKESMLNDDLVTLTDLLEYEIKDMFTLDLRKVLKALSDSLSNG